METTQKPRSEPAQLLDVKAVLGISSRHVYRLTDAGKMPRSVKLGGAVRWSRQAITDWVAAGCPPTTGRASR